MPARSTRRACTARRSSRPIRSSGPALVRLSADGAWFDGDHGERRVGGRIALLATLRIDGRPVTLADVHFESHSDPHEPRAPR